MCIRDSNLRLKKIGPKIWSSRDLITMSKVNFNEDSGFFSGFCYLLITFSFDSSPLWSARHAIRIMDDFRSEFASNFLWFRYICCWMRNSLLQVVIQVQNTVIPLQRNGNRRRVDHEVIFPQLAVINSGRFLVERRKLEVRVRDALRVHGEDSCLLYTSDAADE